MFGKGFSSVQAHALAASLVAVSTADKHVLDNDVRTTQNAIRLCKILVHKKMTEIGCPGMVVGVSVNGKNIWTCGFGYSDIENGVTCKPETVMRIASISKCITMAAVGKLLETGKLDLDKPVQEYVPEFPEKEYEDEKVKLTTRMLLSNTGGIRHYRKKGEDAADSEFQNAEYLSMKPYKNVTEALKMFKDDALFHKPGKQFLYTTHGWTLVSAVVEKICGKDFTLHMKNMFHELGMVHTFAESATEIIYCRARHYKRNEKGRLVNVPYVDNSYKWAGGGFISNVLDLLRFGNVMLYSIQYSENLESCKNLPHGFLKQETVQNMWHPHVKTGNGIAPEDESYGMGWFVYPEVRKVGCGKDRDFEVVHTGGAIGASSVLYVCPDNSNNDVKPPKGIVIAILTNLQSVNLTELARLISGKFKFLVQE